MVNFKTTVRVLIWTVIIVFVLFLFIRAGDYFGYILGGLGGAGALLVGAKVYNSQSEDLKNRANSLKDRVNKRRAGSLLILCVLGLLFCRPVAALYIPDDYETLKKYYIQADQDLTEALDIIEEYQKREELYLKKINDYKRPRWCLVAGAYINQEAHLKLGVGRKWDNYLVSIGGVYQDSVGIYCEAVVWLQSLF